MTPESDVIAELRPLLDALCEEFITAEQLRRLEELVLTKPEAEAHYVQFMSFYADLIENVAGLPAPSLNIATTPTPVRADDTRVEKPSEQKTGAPGLVGSPHAPGEAPHPERADYQPNRAKKESPMKTRFSTRWQIAAAAFLVLAVLGVPAAAQYIGWLDKSRATADKQAMLDASRGELARFQAEQQAAREAAQKALEPARAAEQTLTNEYQAALLAARKAIEDKDFVVRLTGPAHIQPGAPNKWQIETLRHGAVGRPKKLEVVVKDAKDAELFRQTHDKPVGAASLELTTAFWEKVKPGSDLFLEVIAYTDDDRKSAIAERIPLARPVYVTHLATDKPLYKPGETIRFRSLTLDRASLKPPGHDLHLRFRLRDPGDAVVPLDEGNGRLLSNLQPVLGPDKKPLRGIGVGEHPLSPDAPGGEYKLDLFEVVENKDVLLETRKFIVNRYVPDTFEKKLEFDGKSYGAGDYVQARIDVSRTAGGPMKDAKATVVASVDGREFHKQVGDTFALVGAKAVLNVRFKLPAGLSDRANAVLSVAILDGSDAENILRPIPLVAKNLSVEFFPEGGDMIDGVLGRVYFQVRTPIGKPADLKGYITDGTTKLVDVATRTDAEHEGVNRGHGFFVFTPKAGTKYFLKLTSPNGIVEPTKDGYPLPSAKADGVALASLDAVTLKGAPIRVRLQANQGPKTLHVGAYARGRLIGHQKLEVEAGKPVDVSLNGDDAAGGVTRVTVFEEPKADGPGRATLIPRAERLVYRAPGEQLILNVNPDKTRYSPGGKVRLELSAFNEKQTATPAVLLVGVINRSVISMADNKTDRLMPTHFLLSGDVKHPAELEHADFLLTDHPKAAVALDLLLATQGWRRFAEQTGGSADPADKADVDRMLVAHGQRTSPPLELFKLEAQRVNAEFQPKLEQARLQVATTEMEANATLPPLAVQLSAATADVAAAEVQKKEAAEALTRYESRFDKLRSAIVPVLSLILVVLVAVYVVFMVAGTATQPARRGRPIFAGAAAVALCGLIVVAMTNLGSNTNSTFAFVGSSIRSPGTDDRGERVRREGVELGIVDNVGMMPNNALPAMGVGGIPDYPGAPRPPSPRDDFAGPVPKPDPKSEPAKNALDKFKLRDQVGRVQGSVVKLRKADGRNLSAGGEPAAEFRFNTQTEFEAVVRPVPPVPSFIVREYAHQRDPALGEIRADFTETVYWHPVLVLPDSGKTSIEFQLSDEIARYQVLVAGHTTDGRIGAVTTMIEARKPFSVDPKLPLEISHTDAIDVPIRVTNDSDERRTVAFTLASSGLKDDGKVQSPFDLAPNGKGRRIVRMTADKLQGDATVLVTGISSAADNDTIARTIGIVPDGFPGVGSFSDMIEGRARGSITLPKDIVPGTLKVRLEVYPTSMADLVKGLDGLLREPGGCFEQTSTSNYPNTLILDYLNQSNQVNPEASKRAKGMLDRGYARLMSFECPDTPLKIKQGFEWFGAADRQHEALTAYGLLQFKDMARVHPVDADMIKRTQAFLLSRRDGAGGFKSGTASHSFGAAPKHTHDAYIVWALVESDPDDAEKLDLKKEIEALKVQALDANSAGGKDAYFVALTANILLQRGDREAAHKLLDRLQEKHAKNGAVTGAVTSITRSGGRDLEIETTAMALLGWLRANDPKYATTVKESTKWISQQRGGYGGFGSTQSTIMALKALILFAKKYAHPSESGELQVMVGGKQVAARKFSEKDVEVIGLDLANPEAIFTAGGKFEVEITTDAKQAYPFALSYTYTTLTPVSAPECAVKIETKLGKADANEGETVPLSVKFENLQKKGQGMAVAIVGIPAGMKAPTDLKQLTALREQQQISYFEIRGRELILYWRELAPEQKIALTVDLVCDVPGVYRGPASRGYLYYNADHKHWVEPLSVKIAPLADQDAAK